MGLPGVIVLASGLACQPGTHHLSADQQEHEQDHHVLPVAELRRRPPPEQQAS